MSTFKKCPFPHIIIENHSCWCWRQLFVAFYDCSSCFRTFGTLSFSRWLQVCHERPQSRDRRHSQRLGGIHECPKSLNITKTQGRLGTFMNTHQSQLFHFCTHDFGVVTCAIIETWGIHKYPPVSVNSPQSQVSYLLDNPCAFGFPGWLVITSHYLMYQWLLGALFFQSKKS